MPLVIRDALKGEVGSVFSRIMFCVIDLLYNIYFKWLDCKFDNVKTCNCSVSEPYTKKFLQNHQGRHLDNGWNVFIVTMKASLSGFPYCKSHMPLKNNKLFLNFWDIHISFTFSLWSNSQANIIFGSGVIATLNY